MPTYNVTDPTTGMKVKLTGDSPPTEQELNDIFVKLNKNPAPTPPPQADNTPKWATGQGKFGSLGPDLYGMYGAGRSLFRTGMETLGTTGGAAVGALIPAPGTTSALAGLGFAGSKRVADLMLNEPSDNSAWGITKDVGMGALFQSAGKVISGITKIPSVIRTLIPSAERKAGAMLSSATGKASQYALNTAETKLLEKEIPNLKVSLGEAANDPGLIKLQRALINAPGDAGDISQARKAANLQSIIDYISKKFPEKQGIEDVINQINKRKSDIENLIKITQGKAKTSIDKLRPVDSQETGMKIRSAIETERAPIKTAVTEQYKNLPNEPIVNTNTSQAISDLEKNFNVGDEAVHPSKAIKSVNDALKPKGVILGTDNQIIQGAKKGTIDFQDLHSLRKDVGRQMWDATKSGNRELALKLGKIQSAIDADIEMSMGTNSEYVQARNAYREYAQRFRTGVTGTVTKSGSQFTGYSTPEGIIGNKFATVDGADDLIRALGKDKAKAVMEGHFANDLLKKGEDISSGQLTSWLSRNGKVLDKYGLRGSFEDVSKAHEAVDAAQNLQTQYSKSIAAKLLNADPKNMISSVMSGAEGVSAKNTGEIMQRLINQMRGDKDAIIGLKNSFKDFIYDKAKTTAKTIAGDETLGSASFKKAMEKYNPAMEVLYKDEPQKLNALKYVQRAVETANRSASNPVGAGSDTASNLLYGTGAQTLGMIVGHTSRVAGISIAVGKKIFGVINEASEQQANNLVMKAMYDPELAKTLMMAKNSSRAFRSFTKQLSTMAIISGKNLAVEATQPNKRQSYGEE